MVKLTCRRMARQAQKDETISEVRSQLEKKAPKSDGKTMAKMALPILTLPILTITFLRTPTETRWEAALRNNELARENTGKRLGLLALVESSSWSTGF